MPTEKQVKKFCSVVMTQLPDLSTDVMQHWINNPRKLAMFLAGLNPLPPVGANIIDCDADPFIPDGWSVEEYQKGGQILWNPDDFELWLSPDQQGDKYIEGNKLRDELMNQPVVNANVLDYLLANPHLIPEAWKGKAVFFWGTIFRSPRGDAYVRYLFWRDGRWDWRAGWLDSDWGARGPTLVVRK